jgi:hypothetical protein
MQQRVWTESMSPPRLYVSQSRSCCNRKLAVCDNSVNLYSLVPPPACGCCATRRDDDGLVTRCVYSAFGCQRAGRRLVVRLPSTRTVLFDLEIRQMIGWITSRGKVKRIRSTR